MAVLPRTLDIAEAQVLVHFPGDLQGNDWQHRLLLHRIAGGRWVALDPDHQLVIHDLNAERHTVLGRNANFPRGAGYDNAIYAFDPLRPAELREFKGLAKLQAALLADGDDPVAAVEFWVISDPACHAFGQPVAEDDLADPDKFVCLATKGLLDIEGEIWYCRKVKADERAAVLQQALDDKRDQRVLGRQIGDEGRKPLSLVDAVAAFTQQDFADWPFQGDRAAKEYFTSIANAQGNLVTYENEWRDASGIAEGVPCNHEHRNISEVFRIAHSIDHLNVPNLACFEQLVRRQIQIEMAVERNPKAPDFAGLHVVLGSSISAKGSASAPKFKEWVAGRQREEGQTLKQARLLREEKKADRKGKGKGKDEKDKGE